MDTESILSAVRDDQVEWAEVNPYYKISTVSVKRYPAMSFLVQTTGEPIALGSATMAIMDAEPLRDYMAASGIQSPPNHPLEVYLFNWVERAQSDHVFDVGYVVPAEITLASPPANAALKHYEPMTVASIIYTGPFPYQAYSGWGHIDWEGRTQRAGLHYTERLYREFYHLYDFETNWHVTEIQLQIADPDQN